MVQLSFAIGIVIAFTALSIDFVAALSIKSKTASGDGCPTEHWVATNVVVPNSRSNFTNIEIQYPDLGPEVTAEQSKPFAARSCQVMLELDQLPVGQQVAMTTSAYSNVVFYAYGADDWIFRIISEIQYGDGPIAIVRCNPLLCSSTRR
jgi:hypothetical protein